MPNKVNITMLRTFSALASGESVPASQMKSRWAQQLIDDQMVRQYKRGGGLVYKISYPEVFMAYIHEHYGVHDIDAAIKTLESDDCSRSMQVDVLGNSKAQKHNGFPGFMINTLDSVDIRLNGQRLSLPPIEGSCHYIFDYKGLSVPEDAVIVGLENGENLLHLSRQLWLFKKHIPVDKPWIFVCRYTQTDSLRQWLQSIPNRYIHFGDLDLFGIRIYLTEFYNLLGERASMLIPDDFETRIANSPATWLYSDQLDGVKNLDITDPRVRQLWDCLHKYHRGYEQEGYISKD